MLHDKMNIRHPAILIICILCKTTKPFFSNNEVIIVSQLSKELRQDHCIFINRWEEESGFLPKLKNHFTRDISATHFNISELIKYIRKGDTVYYNTMLVLKEKDMQAVGKLLKKLKKVGLFNKISRYTWLAFPENIEITDNAKKLLFISYNVEFIIAEPQTEIYYVLKEIYKIDNHIFISNFGKWNPEDGLNIKNTFMYQRRLDLNQTKAALAFNLHPDLEKSKESIITQEVLHSISYMMNIRFVAIIRPIKNDSAIDQFYAELLKYEFLIYGDTVPSFSASQGSIYEAFTTPIYTTKFNYYIKQPTFRLRSDYYIQPFDTKYWTAIIFSLVIGIITTVIVQYFRFEKENRSSIDDLYLSLELFCNQNGNEELKNIPLRIISFSLSINNIFIFGAFGAVITSFLAARIPEIPFFDLQSFFENGRYRFAIPNQEGMASPIEFLILEQVNLTDELFGELSIFYNEEKEIERICHENLAFADNDFSIYEKNISCNLYQIRKPLAEKPVSLFLGGYGSPFRKVCNYNILRISESGIQNRMKRNISKPREVVEEDEFLPIEFEQMTQVLAIPFIGIIFSTTIIILEKAYKRYEKQIITLK